MAEEETEAMRWLRAKLADCPQHIAALVCEWCGGQQMPQKDGELQWEGGRDGTHGRWIADLNAARAEMGVQAYINDDGKWWWRLPAAREHSRDLVRVESLARSVAATGRAGGWQGGVSPAKGADYVAYCQQP